MLPQGPYNPAETEARILKFWLENKFYKPEYLPAEDRVQTTDEMKADARQPWALICPPPNAYAKPHLGNISGYAYQDVFARHARMHGKKVLMVPGKDHAAQEAEVIFVRDILGKQGKKKEDFTREEFYQACYEYFSGIAEIAREEEKAVGLSADFDRDIFTLDPRVATTIYETFFKLVKDNMVYKDVRIVNWSPGMKSVVPDIETERKEREAEMVYIKYPLVNDPSKFIEVATTRPETMLGDTAVVVDPTDERYAAMIGQKVLLPLVNRQIPIIANGRVDKEFGTGAVKMTPAHSLDDYIMMQEWNYKKDFAHMPDSVKTAREQVGEIGYINVIWKDMRMAGPIGKYAGMTIKEAKEAVLTDLDAAGLISKRETITQNVVICSRSKSVIEPMMSSQWFVDVDKLKEPAIAALEKGDINVYPDNMHSKVMHWLKNLRDWPISRSIWWGYRFPVWYQGELSESVSAEGKIILKIGDTEVASLEKGIELGLVKFQLESPGEGWVQDSDVFDTWFSSGQWPFATLNAWELMDTFFPTNTMVMGYGILELWCSRMIMLSLYTQAKVPFKDVYLHGHIDAQDGRKMSKSLGNVVYADDLIKRYSTDALRLFYLVGNKAGANYRVDSEKLEGNKRFLNKVWNASKFVMMNLTTPPTDNNEGLRQAGLVEDAVFSTDKPTSTLPETTALLEHVVATHAEVSRNLENYNVGVASHVAMNNFWHEFCDIHIEAVKKYLYVQKDKETGAIISEPKAEEMAEARQVLYFALFTYLKLLHPFAPFITEEIYQSLRQHLPANDSRADSARSLMYVNWE
jgi:valyl-tRNA synthetase